MAKPAPERVNSDDCEVVVNGVTCRPHEGEWVELYRVRTFSDWAADVAFQFPTSELDDAKGEPDEARRSSLRVRDWYTAICEALAQNVVAWNWTDLRGKPLPPPSLAVLRECAMGELLYLFRIQRDESAAEGKGV